MRTLPVAPRTVGPTAMTFLLRVIVGGLLFGFSPGLAVIAVALGAIVVDRVEAALLDRVVGRG
jgi:hypothetical protein